MVWGIILNSQKNESHQNFTQNNARNLTIHFIHFDKKISPVCFSGICFWKARSVTGVCRKVWPSSRFCLLKQKLHLGPLHFKKPIYEVKFKIHFWIQCWPRLVWHVSLKVFKKATLYEHTSELSVRVRSTSVRVKLFCRLLCSYHK